MNRKTLAISILAVWVAAFGWLVQREYLQGSNSLLLDQPLNVSPGATYYRLSVGGVQVGFQTTSVDTVADTVRVLDLTLLNVPAGGRGQRIETRTTANLSRSLRLRGFESSIRAGDARLAVTGAIESDSVLSLTMRSSAGEHDIAIDLREPVVLPSHVPMRLAFGRRITIGQTETMEVFDPLLLQRRSIDLRVTAESTFVVADSADQPEGQLEWIPARWDTVHAWHVTFDDGVFPFDAWIDDLGQVVSATTPSGFYMERTAFEIAYENFGRGDSIPLLDPSTGTELVRATTTAANVSTDRTVQEFRVRLEGIDLAWPALESGQQQLAGDTLVVMVVDSNELRADWRLPNRDATLREYRVPAPLIPSTDQRVQAQARQIVGSTRNPTRAVGSLVDWVHAEIDPRESTNSLDAVDVLASRRGDSSEHTTLFVAMARAVDIPARPVSGLVYVDGRFYYHAWAEVHMREWVPVDPTFGQWPADAARVRLLVGGLARQLELMRVVGNLSFNVLEARSE
jgi:hypothetical protein